MAKLLNIDSATNADIQYDGTDPILTLTNSSGAGLATNKLNIESTILAANATITAIDIRGASVASGAVMTFSSDAAKSLATILATTGGAAGTYGIRVVVADGTFGWIPIYPDAAVTGAAV